MVPPRARSLRHRSTSLNTTARASSNPPTASKSLAFTMRQAADAAENSSWTVNGVRLLMVVGADKCFPVQ